MVSAVGWMCAKEGHPVYRKLTEDGPEEHNTAIQLFGKDPVVMAEAAQRAAARALHRDRHQYGLSGPQGGRLGEGSALLKTPIWRTESWKRSNGTAACRSRSRRGSVTTRTA
jgi:hypothetical protein